MGKGARLRRERAGRPTQRATDAAPDWRSFGGPGPAFDWQAERAGCPVGDRCEHCGVADGLAVQLAWMGDEVACATSCGPCDGKSVLTMLGGFGGYARRAAEHRTHRVPDVDGMQTPIP